MPEEVQKRSVGRQPLAKLRRQIEGRPAVEKRADREIVAGEVVEQRRVHSVLEMQPADTVKDTGGLAGIRVTTALGMRRSLHDIRIAAARERLATINIGQGDHLGRQRIKLPG